MVQLSTMNSNEVQFVQNYSTFYISEFPLQARFLLKDAFNNLDKLQDLFHNTEEIGERILNELESKTDSLPDNDQNRIIRIEILNFINQQREDLASFWDKLLYYYNLEQSNAPNEIASQLTIVKRLSKSIKEVTDFEDYLIKEIRELQELQSNSCLPIEFPRVEKLKNNIRTYEQDYLLKLTAEIRDIPGFVDGAMQLLAKYQRSESVNLTAYVKELRTSWKTLLDILQQLRGHIDKFENELLPSLMSEDDINMYQPIDKENIDIAIDYLMSHSLIIVEFPPWKERSLRATKKTFAVTLNILLPEISDSTEVKAFLLNQNGYVRLKETSMSTTPSDEDCTTTSLYQPLVCLERNQSLKINSAKFTQLGFDTKINRKRPKSTPVMAVKHVYMFSAELGWQGRKVIARCFSLPIVLATHNDQSIEGSASIFWDNNFPIPNREGFQVREDVSWNELKRAIKMLITTETGRGPTEMNMDFIRKLFMGHRRSEEVKDDDPIFKLSDLYRPTDGKHTTTFWDWLLGTIHILTSKDVKNINRLWCSGYIVGYIDRSDVDEIIKMMQERTGEEHCFLLRFSKREGKAIVLHGYVEDEKGNHGIHPVDPYKLENLRESPLERRLLGRKDCVNLVYQTVGNTWACESKYEILDQFVDQENQSELPDGYVRRIMVESTKKVRPVQVEEVEEEIVFDECNQIIMDE